MSRGVKGRRAGNAPGGTSLSHITLLCISFPMILAISTLVIVIQLTIGAQPASPREQHDPRHGRIGEIRPDQLGPPRDKVEELRRRDRKRAEKQEQTERWNETWGWTVYPMLTALAAYSVFSIYFRYRCPQCRRLGCRWTGRTKGFSFFSWGRDEMKCKYCESTKWVRASPP